MQAENLKLVMEKHPECLIAAYADIRTNVALVVADGPVSVPMDALEELCFEAALTLGVEDAPSMGGNPAPFAIKLVDHAFFVFVRAPDEPSEAYLFMCRPSVDVESFLLNARQQIGQIQ